MLNKLLFIVCIVFYTSMSSVLADPPQLVGNFVANTYNFSRTDETGADDNAGQGFDLRHSYIGVQGIDDINSDLRVYYKFIQSFEQDNFSQEQDFNLTTREISVGLNSRNLGIFNIGKERTALSRSTVEGYFEDSYADSENFGDESYYYPMSLNYTSATWKNSRIALTAIPTSDSVSDSNERSKFDDAYSWAYMWGNKSLGFYGAYAQTVFNPDERITENRERSERFSIGLTYKNFVGSGYYEANEYDDTADDNEANEYDDTADDNEGWQVNFGYKLNQLFAKVKWSRYTYKNVASDKRGFAYGIDYHLSQRTTFSVNVIRYNQKHERIHGEWLSFSQKF